MAHVTWDKGGDADLLSIDGDAIAVSSSIPSPPGSRLAGRVGALEVRVKVHSSKKQEDGRFRIEGRIIDATRDARAALASLLSQR